MDPKLKTFLSLLFILAVSGLFAVPALWADPSDNVMPDNPLYQRVKDLGNYGLLDPQDQKVLDEGRVVTRLELAFYTEKAKARISTPQYTPTVPSSLPTPQVSLPAPAPPAPARPTPTPKPARALPPAAPAPSLPAPLAQPAPSKGALQSEIDELLKELHQESEVLRYHVSLDDYRIEQEQAQLDKLKDVQDEVDATFRKANKSGGVPHFSSISDVRVENVHVSGLTQVSATSIKNEVNLGVWSDLGGKGSISLGLGSYLYSSASDNPSAPASIYLFSPSVNWSMDGQLGHWDNHIAVEAYTSDTDLGDFTRGNPLSNLRYEEPFEIKRYSTDKDMKNWDDYMTNLGYVPSATSWVAQSSTGIVFDGFYMLGSHLPLVSSDAKATILFGRMGRNATYLPETHRLEEGLKYSQPWLNGFLQTSFTGYWNNEDLGVTPPGPHMDSQNYEADLGFDLQPFFLSFKGGYSQFFTGIDTANPNNPTPLEAPAGQASLSFYPLTLYYTAISDTYTNSQGSAYLAGLNFSRFGYTGGSYATNATNLGGGVTALGGTDYQYGFIGMVDDLISDRHGWRANLGWKGRQADWMKDWPSIFDDLIVNFDVAQNTEYTMIPDESGHNVIESYELVTVYYPDDTGMWGSNIWGGYGGVHPMGQAYSQNIANVRNDGFQDFYLTQLGVDYMQRIPFILPVYSSPGVIQQSGGHNVFTNLDNLKTFNYITLTTKWQLNKMLGMAEPFYGSFFFTNHQISGITANPALVNMPDPNRPGQTLANIPDLFNQTVYDIAGLYQVAKNLNLLADYGLELWTSNYTYPVVNWRTDSYGLGLAYDLPWGGGKLELRYKHLNYQDYSVVSNDYQADQVYSYFLFQF